jgi:hypothetical protein
MNQATPPGAEYAVRWDAADGGPRDLDAVAALLRLSPRKTQQARVSFLSVAQPAGLPKGYRLIGRERIFVKSDGQEKPEVMLKLRGPDP